MGAAKPSATPRPVAKSGSLISPLSKKKPAPNASILSFFKKVPAPEDSLFVCGAATTVSDLGVSPLEDAQDLCIDDGDDGSGQDRYNELQAPVKKRKLSGSPHEQRQLVHATSDSTGRASSAVEAASSVPQPPPPRNGRRKGPFLDDSDSEDDGKPASTQTSLQVEETRDAASLCVDAKNETSCLSASLSSSLAPPPPIDPQPPLDVSEDSLGKDEQGLSAELDDFPFMDELSDSEEFGEEDRERRFMLEQAKIEAEEAEMDRNNQGDGPLCPICSGSLAGITSTEATVHVNSCLDGNPTPLPAPPGPARSPPAVKPEGSFGDCPDKLDSLHVSRRFARAAVARPGQANPIVLDPGEDSGPRQTQGGGGAGSAFARLMSGHAESSAWASAAAAEQASRGKQAYERTCPFYKIMPGLSICVDAFRYGAVAGCKAYFLSHFHSDHYIGLTANWSHGPIYCSKVTGSLVKSQLRTAAKYVVELEFEERFVIPDTNGATVTMIPANHCPGSSMFLFEKAVGRGSGARVQRILHCGDFRACPAHVNHPQLQAEVTNSASGKTLKQKIDFCYLDTTYLNPRYSFPPQEDVIRACADLCAILSRGMQENDDAVWERVLGRREGSSRAGHDNVSRYFIGGASRDKGKDSDGAGGGRPPSVLTALNPRTRLLVVCGTYSIGKERICTAIAKALRTKIFATPSKIRLLSQLGDEELTALMTSNPAEAQVHMQSLAEIRAETLLDYLASYRAHFGRIVGFRPSGWNYRPAGTAANAAVQPLSIATTALLHGAAWRPTYASANLAPQRGSGKEAMCFGVPYSEHSSFRELAMFLMSLNIEKVVPTVNVGSETSRKRMRGWTDRWLAERRRGGIVRAVVDEEGQDEDVDLWDGKTGRGGAVRW